MRVSKTDAFLYLLYGFLHVLFYVLVHNVFMSCQNFGTKLRN